MVRRYPSRRSACWPPVSEPGEDLLTGGAGRDRLNGGSDAEMFLFLSAKQVRRGVHATNVVLDLEKGIDLIDFSATNAKSKKSGHEGN